MKSTLGKVLARGCAAVAVAAPADPVDYLSWWLHKHVENAALLKEFYKDKIEHFEKEKSKQDTTRFQLLKQDEDKSLKTSALNHLRTIKDDPYKLWRVCLQAVTTFTSKTRRDNTCKDYFIHFP